MLIWNHLYTDTILPQWTCETCYITSDAALLQHDDIRVHAAADYNGQALFIGEEYTEAHHGFAEHHLLHVRNLIRFRDVGMCLCPVMMRRLLRVISSSFLLWALMVIFAPVSDILVWRVLHKKLI